MPKECPKCHTLWTNEDRFCGKCGIVLDQEPLPEPGPEADFEEDEERIGGATAAGLWFLDLLPGIASAKVLVCSIITFVLALIALWLAAAMLVNGVWITMFFCGAGGIILYWTAWSWLLVGDVCVPVEAMAEFQGKHWTMLIMVTVIPIGLLFWVARTIAEGMANGS